MYIASSAVIICGTTIITIQAGDLLIRHNQHNQLTLASNDITAQSKPYIDIGAMYRLDWLLSWAWDVPEWAAEERWLGERSRTHTFTVYTYNVLPPRACPPPHSDAGCRISLYSAALCIMVSSTSGKVCYLLR